MLISQNFLLTKASAVPAVVLDGVSKGYGGHKVLDDLSLIVPAGEFLAILGPSGSGKTTAMRLIGGFEFPDAGQVHIAGENVTALSAERRRVNTVFQGYALFPHMTVLQNIEYGPRMKGVSRPDRRQRALALLDLVQLPHVANFKPTQLSGGMQQRVALARALANEPQVLLLDEPLGALDRKLREEMQRELRRIQADRGATFIYITHDREEAFGMADRLAMLRGGKFAQIGSPAEIFDSPTSAWVAQLLGPVNLIPVISSSPNQFASAAGPIAAAYVEPGLSKNAVAIIRPDHLHFLPDNGAPETVNHLRAVVTDSVTLGADQRLRAITTGGLTLESLLQRRADDSAPLPGDTVIAAFAPEAVRIHRNETP